MEDRRRRLTASWWYARRAVPWIALLVCCTGAVVAAAALHRWPSTAATLLPAALGCCAAAGAFVFDEREEAITGVTPRARWRLAARAGVAAVPLAVWWAIVALRPDDVPLDRPAWWLIGGAALLLTVGAAGVATRLDQPSPGSAVAAVAAGAVFAPLVVTSLLDWPSPYPAAALTTGVGVFWLAVGAVGLAACLATLRAA